MSEPLSPEEEDILAQVLEKAKKAIDVLPRGEDLEVVTDQLRPNMLGKFRAEMNRLGYTAGAVLSVPDGILFIFEKNETSC